jgi:hypothetical protein
MEPRRLVPMPMPLVDMVRRLHRLNKLWLVMVSRSLNTGTNWCCQTARNGYCQYQCIQWDHVVNFSIKPTTSSSFIR